MKIENGKKYVFHTTQTDYLRYNGTEVTVVRPLTEDEADIADVGKMYEVVFNDGVNSHAFEDELSLPVKSWKVPVSWQCCAVITVEASSLAEAIEIAKDEAGVIPLPDDWEYVDGSWELSHGEGDEDYVRQCYNDNQTDVVTADEVKE